MDFVIKWGAAAFGWLWKPLGGSLANLTSSILTTGTSITVMLIIIHTALVKILLPLVSALLNTMLRDSNVMIESKLIHDIWQISLNIANGMFLLALIVASIAIILRIDTGTYQIKKAATTLILAVVLSNISLLVVRALVEFGDLLAAALSSIGNSDPLLSTGAYLAALADIPVIKLGDGVTGAIINMVLAVMIFWVLFKITIFVFERALMVALLAVAAPLSFASALLPGLKEYSKNWWPMAIKWTLAWPIFVGITKIATLFLNKLATPATIIQELGKPLAMTETVLNINIKYIFAVIGLFILYYASELPKKLSLSAPISGFVGTGADVLAGKSPLNKAGSYIGNTFRNTGPGIAMEGWRKAQIGQGGKTKAGKFWNRVVANTVNRKAMQDISAANTEKGVTEKNIDNIAYQAQEQAKLLAKQKKLVTDKDGNIIKTHPAYKTYKATEDRHKALLGSLQYNNEQLNKKTSLESIDSADDLKEKLRKAIAEDKAGDAARAAYRLRTLARSHSRRPEDAKIAQDVLNSDKVKAGLDNMGLKASSYAVPASGQSGDYDTTMDEALIRAEENKNTLRASSDITDPAVLNMSADGTNLDSLEQLNAKLNESSAFGTLDTGDKKKYLSDLINARNKTKSTNINDLLQQLARDNYVSVEDLSNTAEAAYTEINKALSEAVPNNDAQAIGKAQVLFDKVDSGNVGDVIIKLKELQNAEKEITTIKGVIDTDTKNSEQSYINTIQTDIENSAIKNIENTLGGVKLDSTNMDAHLSDLSSIKNAKLESLKNVYEEMEAKLKYSLKKYGSGHSNQLVDTADVNNFTLDAYREAIRNIPASTKFFPSSDELDNAKLGELAVYQRQVLNALKKIQF
jgi:hypothetical protein